MPPAPPAETGGATPDQLRTYWALERTFLAWIRTSLALMGFGFLVARFGLFARQLLYLSYDGKLPAHVAPSGAFNISVGVGVVLVLIGSAVSAFAVVQYRAMLTLDKQLRQAANYGPYFQVGIGLFLSILGLALSGHLLAMGR